MCSSELSQGVNQQVKNDPQFLFQDATTPELVEKGEELLQAPKVPTRTFVWRTQANVGDCEMAPNATITFRSDGWGFFDASVKSNDSGDFFRVGFNVMEGNSVIARLPIVGTYQWKCPDNHSFAIMHVDFQLSPIYFNRITGVTRFFYNCSG